MGTPLHSDRMGVKPMSMSRNTENQITAFQNAPFYDSFWRNWPAHPVGQEIDRLSFVERTLDELQVAGANILDLGCGRGWIAPHVSRFGTLTGVDFSSDAIEFARTHYSNHASFVVVEADQDNFGLQPD